MKRRLVCLFGVGIACLGVAMATAGSGDPRRTPAVTPAERGRDALLGKAFVPAIWTRQAYDQAWKQWGAKEKPADYPKAFIDRYGLHAAPYPNGELPMGIREGRNILLGKGLTNDCMICHGGSIFGQSYVGLGNSTLDLQALYEDLSAADGLLRGTPFTFSHVRGTTEAAAMSIYLFRFRDPDLNLVPPAKFEFKAHLCEDVPAWWLLKKKQTMYHTGSTPARSVRSIMQFMLSPITSGDDIKKEEPVFADIQKYILSLEPPKYPLSIDVRRAAQGRELFTQHCAKCHGSYGPDGVYPNKLVPLATIGTDRSRAEAFTDAHSEMYNRTWFGQERGPDGELYQSKSPRGYQAPPLDGIWATAPYFHNGSVPTVYHVLNSKARPKLFTRSFRTEKEDYDPVKLGWKFTEIEKAPGPNLPAIERRKVYDTSQPGRGNSGHTFGDDLIDAERWAIIEYLKTL